MDLIRVLGWEVEVDAAQTARVQAERESGSPESCGCLHCKNFVAARQLAYPPEALRFLRSLGVPENRESELYHCGEIEPGVHFYGGWFHFIGRIASGPEAPSDGPNGGRIRLEAISDRFSMGFTRKTALVPESFPADTVGQVEFSAHVPWVLSEPYVG